MVYPSRWWLPRNRKFCWKMFN